MEDHELDDLNKKKKQSKKGQKVAKGIAKGCWFKREGQAINVTIKSKSITGKSPRPKRYEATQIKIIAILFIQTKNNVWTN